MLARQPPTICGNASSVVSITGSAVPSGMTGSWTASDGTISFGNINAANTTITNLPFGTHTITWTVSNGNCTAQTANFNITLVEGPGVVTASTPTPLVCGDASTTIAINGSAVPAGMTGTWTASNGAIIFDNANSANTSIRNVPIGTHTVTWSVSNGACTPSTASFTVTLQNQAVVLAGSDQTICELTATLNATDLDIAAGENGIWTVEAGTGVFVDDTDPKSGVSGLTQGAVKPFSMDSHEARVYGDFRCSRYHDNSSTNYRCRH